MSFDGDLYPTAGATSVMTTKGDMVDYDTIRQRLAIGSANQILQVKSALPSWQTVPLADTVLTTAGDILYEDATPALARLASGTQYNTLQMGASLPAWQASATSVLTTTGDLLYASGANTLARLAGGTSGDVLTANGAGVAPSYQTAGGGGSLEFIATQTSTTNDFAEFTFATAVDFTAYSEMYCSFALGTTSSRDIQVHVGDTTDGAVLTDATYDQTRSDNTAGTFTNETLTGGTEWYMGTHARVDSEEGVSGYVRIYLTRNSSDETFLATQGFAQGADSFFLMSGKNTTADATDLKYFRISIGTNGLVDGSNITCYKVKRS